MRASCPRSSIICPSIVCTVALLASVSGCDDFAECELTATCRVPDAAPFVDASTNAAAGGSGSLDALNSSEEGTVDAPERTVPLLDPDSPHTAAPEADEDPPASDPASEPEPEASEEPSVEPDPRDEPEVEALIDAGGNEIDGGEPSCSDDGGCDEDDSCDEDAGPCPCEEAETRPCTVEGHIGACALGVQTCDENGEWEVCTVQPRANDSCALGSDDNCDGIVNSPLDPTCECVEADTRCAQGNSSSAVQVCTNAGTWSISETCPFVCLADGVCGGVCTPSARECNGNVPRGCDESGEWQSETPCPAATPCQGEGECKECAPGSYALNGACVPFSDCLPGQYVVTEGNPTSDRQCGTCATGTFSVNTNAATCSAWSTCDAGEWVSTVPNARTDRECSACGSGSFSTASNASSCTDCAFGTFAETSGSTQCDAWSTCIQGQHIAMEGTSESDRECEPCANGTFSTLTDAEDCTPFTECLPGYMEATPGGATFDRTCKSIPSCSGISSGCGASGDESCCTSLLVPGGTFEQENDARFPTTVGDFRLDKFEVTVSRFGEFVDAWDAGYRPAAGSGKHTHLNEGNGLVNNDASSLYETGWDTAWSSLVDTSSDARGVTMPTWTSNPAAVFRPINYVNWYEAYAFCIWDSGFLPTAAEANYAAAGGAEQRFYPWSSPPDSTVITSSHASYGCLTCTIDDIARVGTHPNGNGRWGHADLAGNVEEWTLDSTPGLAACINCATMPPTKTAQVLQAGSFEDDEQWMETAQRTSYGPTRRDRESGFRCARRP